MEKRLVDKIRESGGHADIGTAEEGAIVEIFYPHFFRPQLVVS